MATVGDVNNEITRIEQDKAAVRTALQSKGETVGEGETLGQYAAHINNLTGKDLGISGAKAGQILEITEVDGNGKPLRYNAVNSPGEDVVVYEYALPDDVESISDYDLRDKLDGFDRLEVVYYGKMMKGVPYTLSGYLYAKGGTLGAFYGASDTINDDNPRQWGMVVERYAPNSYRVLSGTRFGYDPVAVDAQNVIFDKMCWSPNQPIDFDNWIRGVSIRANGGKFIKGGIIRFVMHKRRPM